MLIRRDTTLPHATFAHSSERKSKTDDEDESEGEGGSENDAFASKY